MLPRCTPRLEGSQISLRLSGDPLGHRLLKDADPPPGPVAQNPTVFQQLLSWCCCHQSRNFFMTPSWIDLIYWKAWRCCDFIKEKCWSNSGEYLMTVTSCSIAIQMLAFLTSFWVWDSNPFENPLFQSFTVDLQKSSRGCYENPGNTPPKFNIYSLKYLIVGRGVSFWVRGSLFRGFLGELSNFGGGSMMG